MNSFAELGGTGNRLKGVKQETVGDPYVFVYRQNISMNNKLV